MKRVLAVALLLSSLFAASSPATAAPPPNADDRIWDQVRMRLTTDADVKGGTLDVVVKDGVVTLKGRVDSDKAKDRAAKLTKKIKGVKSVDNELSVGPPTR